MPDSVAEHSRRERLKRPICVIKMRIREQLFRLRRVPAAELRRQWSTLSLRAAEAAVGSAEDSSLQPQRAAPPAAGNTHRPPRRPGTAALVHRPACASRRPSPGESASIAPNARSPERCHEQALRFHRQRRPRLPAWRCHAPRLPAEPRLSAFAKQVCRRGPRAQAGARAMRPGSLVRQVQYTTSNARRRPEGEPGAALGTQPALPDSCRAVAGAVLRDGRTGAGASNPWPAKPPPSPASGMPESIKQRARCTRVTRC